jgi:hypothetical protein
MRLGHSGSSRLTAITIDKLTAVPGSGAGVIASLNGMASSIELARLRTTSASAKHRSSVAWARPSAIVTEVIRLTMQYGHDTLCRMAVPKVR